MKIRSAAAGVALLLLLGGCAGADQTGAVPVGPGQTGSGEPGQAAAPVGQTTDPPRAAPTLPPTTPPPSSTDPARKAAETLKKNLKQAKKKIYFTMPRLVGHNLQEAQDTLQSKGSYLLRQVDATGAGRLTVVDSDWKVCTQNPKAGAKVPVVQMVKLTAVKLAEHCP